MAKESFEITYAAHTASCTFLLDPEGICRRIVMARGRDERKRRDSSRSAARCVGAQYVASLDSGAAGGLVEMPRVGAAMLFARVDERGRVSLVRTGVVTSFEAKQNHDPFVDSGSVETSAPDLERSPPQASERNVDPDYFDASDRTQRIPALRAEDLDEARDTRSISNDEHDLATAEYHAAQELEPRRSLGPVPTLRPPPRDVDDDDDESYATSARARGMLPRRSDGYSGAAAHARVPAPRSYPGPAPSDIVVSRHRRG